MKRSPSLNFFDVNRFHPVTDRLKGCNALLPNKAALAAQLTVPESNIKNLRYDTANNQMTWHSVANYQITESLRFSNGTNATQFQKDLAAVVTEFESSKITDADSFFFSESNIRVLKMSSFTDIQNEGLRDIRLIEIFELDSLISFNNDSLETIAFNSASPVSLNFPNLTFFGSISGRFTFVQSNFSITNADGSLVVRSWLNQATLPFPQSKLKSGNVGDSFFVTMRAFNQALNLSQITNLGNSCFQDNFALPSLEIINCITIGSFFLNDAFAILLIDIRRCTVLDITSNTITDVPENGTINANIALQDYNGTGVHPRIAYLITRNWTVNYFDI